MNEDIVLKMVIPYIKEGSITYKEFDNLFDFLSRKEQYLVSDILFAHNIELRDEEEADILLEGSEDEEIEIDDEIHNDEDGFKILYDENIFKDSRNVVKGESPLILYNNIKQSNEILCQLIREGNLQARQDICVKNKRLIDKYVKAYEKYYGNHLEFEDLEQAAFLGLIKAAGKFDIRQGTAFSTYAVFWIRQAILREIMNNGFAIRVPVHMMQHIVKVTKLDNMYETQGFNFGERLEMISNELGCPIEFIKQCFVIRKNYLSYSSLNTPVGEDEETELEEFLHDKSLPLVEDIVAADILHEMLEKVLGTLKEREQKVIRLRFGLEDEKARTLEEIGLEFNLTRERIRQIEAKALRKMRHPSRSRKLKDFL